MTVQETSELLRCMPVVLLYAAVMALFYSGIAYLRLRRIFHTLFSALLLFSGLVLMEILASGIKQFYMNNGIIASAVGGHSIIYYWAAAVFLLQIAAWLFYDCGSARRKKLTTRSIKDAYDHLSSGVCYWFPNGKTILINRRMAKIIERICGERRYFGPGFWKLLESGSLPPGAECIQSGRFPVVRLTDGTVYRFRRAELTINNQLVYELTGADITELYQKGEQLEKENLQLMVLNRRIREYSAVVHEVIREKEILNAKENVHSGMNRMLLRSRNAMNDCSGEEQMELLRQWRSDALLLCREAGFEQENGLEDIQTIAKTLGMTVVTAGSPPVDDPNAMNLILNAAAEALTNAKKHANAEHLYVTFGAGGAEFSNDGKAPEGGREGGGLTALRERIERAGGRMEVCFEPKFTLTVTLPETESDRKPY